MKEHNPNTIESVALESSAQGRLAHRSRSHPSTVEKCVLQNALSVHARVAVAKQVLCRREELEEEHFSELVEYMEPLG